LPDQAFRAPNRRTDEVGICPFILCLESLHIFLFLLISVNYFWRVSLVLASPGLDWAAWVISGAIVGILNYQVFHRRSKMISRIALAALLGSGLTAASMIIEPLRSVSVMMLPGAALMSGGIVVVTWLQLQMSEQLLGVASGHAAVWLLSYLLLPLLFMEVRAVGSLLPIVRTASRGLFFDTLGFIEGTEIRLYPYTVVLFALLALQPLWLPIIVWLDKPSLRACLPSTAPVRVASSKRRNLRYALLLVSVVFVGILVSSYRLILGYPLTGDAQYYLSVMRQMDRLGAAHALSTDRPLLFLALHSVRVCLSIEAEALLNYLQIMLTGALAASTYLLIDSCFKDERLALLSAFLASISPHVTIGIGYFVIGNWFGLILLTFFYMAVVRSQEAKSHRWAVLAVALSWLMLGIHFPTWMFAILVLITYSLISFRKVELISQAQKFLPVKIAVGALLAVLPAFVFSLVIPEMSMIFQNAWSRIMASLVRLGPLNFASFLQDEILLSSYFAKGSYAIPLMYVLSLFGLYKLYRIREGHTQLLLSWMMVASIGILVVPKFEQWRLLYMMPIEILAAEGVLYTLMSVNLLKESRVSKGKAKVWLRGIGFVMGLLLCGAIPLFVSASSLPMVLCFMTLGGYLSHDLDYSEVSQMAAIEIVLLYMLAGTAHALYSLR
jgi:hypothetical protein